MRRSPVSAPRRGCARRAAGALLGGALLLLGLGSSAGASGDHQGVIQALGAENDYANVLAQIGGRYVHVSAVLINPNTDPHTFEANVQVAQAVSDARLIVQNGAGYDAFMNKLESADPQSGRRVIVAQQVLGLPSDTPNPHLWYAPRTMPAVAASIEHQLTELAPQHASYFAANLARFDASLGPWLAAISAFKARYAGTPVATTEPVADDLLNAMGMDNLTPFQFQADVMNGVDPAPQDVSLEESSLSRHRARAFVYNEQVVDTLTTALKARAERAGVPVVGVYETMPTGYTYQRWMMAELRALQRAVTTGRSTDHL